ncbi:hypothetical protein MBLNU459_g0398t1 [Dothideomycetes sp. NU459]
MAAIASSCRFAAVLTSRHARRGFRAAAANHAAQSFTMPALSPTMTEGNIAAWRVKEGDSFSAGDVLLEIETDKATMDVEAQDDGIMAKIIQADGSKAVQVGERIGVLAEPGDDIASLEMPAEEKSSSAGKPDNEGTASPQQEEKAAATDKSKSSESQAEAPPSSKSDADTATSTGASESSGQIQKQKYPLYPSVQHLLLQNGLSKADADKIPSSGPGGRLLKGDVLAYMGKIAKSYSADQSKRIEKMGHLDLSNIQVTVPKKADAPKPAEVIEAAPEPDTEIALPISLTAVIATQKRVEDTLGIFLPLSTFIARASELANEDLPLSKNRVPTSDELFNSVLGLDKISTKTSRGRYIPQITTLGPTPILAQGSRARKSDIIDFLSAKPTPKMPAKAVGAIGAVAPHNVFSVMAPRGDEKRVQEYLERMKRVLEAEPGRLVL